VKTLLSEICIKSGSGLTGK